MDRDQQVLAKFESKVKTSESAGLEKDTVANRLVHIGETAELFRDERHDGYALVNVDGSRMILRLRSKAFRMFLAGQYYRESGGAAKSEALSNALTVLEAKAIFGGVQHDLFNRFAVREDGIYIDLADNRGRAVHVTASGWEVLDAPPILFRRYSHQAPLPEPMRGGKLDDLDRFLNIKSDRDRVLVKGWLVTAPIENIPRPGLTLYGAQGSAKSTMAKLLRSLLDPSRVENLSFPKDPKEIAQILDHHAVPVFDNLRTVDSMSADMLCRAVTGGGFSKRELYTDAEDVIFTFKRPLILNGINVPTYAPDLLDRLILVELERIAEADRRDEAEFWQDFDDSHGRLFGALLDNMVTMLCNQHEADRLPRMADFAKAAARWAEGNGIGGSAFLALYSESATKQTEEALESDCVACAIRELMASTYSKRWEGTPTELLKILSDGQNPPKPSDWPRRGNSLSKRLRTLQTTFLEVGIKITFTKSGERRITIDAQDRENKPSRPSISSSPATRTGSTLDGSQKASVQTAQELSARSGSTDAPLGDLDGSDGSLPALSKGEMELEA